MAGGGLTAIGWLLGNGLVLLGPTWSGLVATWWLCGGGLAGHKKALAGGFSLVH